MQPNTKSLSPGQGDDTYKCVGKFDIEVIMCSNEDAATFFFAAVTYCKHFNYGYNFIDTYLTNF